MYICVYTSVCIDMYWYNNTYFVRITSTDPFHYTEWFRQAILGNQTKQAPQSEDRDTSAYHQNVRLPSLSVR